MSAVGDRVRIIGRDHPHRGENGRIQAHATGGAAKQGFDWEVELDGAYTGGCFVHERDIRPLVGRR